MALNSYRLSVTFATFVALQIGVEAQATGFFINQQSVPGLGRTDAGNVAAANDPSTIFFNPAGMTQLWTEKNPSRRPKTSIGIHVIIPRSDLDNNGSTASTPGTLGMPVPFVGANEKDPTDPTPIPNLYAAWVLPGNKVYVGLGVTSPFGLSAKYEETWFGRYDSIEAELKTIDIAPTIAFKATDRFSIGVGIDIQYADTTLVTAIPNPVVPGGPTPATDGRFTVEGDDWSVGFNAGILMNFGERVRFGLSYRSGVDHDIKGKSSTQGLTGPLAAFNAVTGAATSLHLPAILTTGIAYELKSKKLTLYGDLSWYEWSDFDTARIQFSNGAPDAVRSPNFRDTYSIAVGAEYNWTKAFTIRGGLKYDRTPTQDGFRDTTFADDNRFWLGVGGSYRYSDARELDFAFVHVFVDSTQVDVTRTFFNGSPLASSIRTRAAVDSTVNTVAVNFRYNF